jgi:hypothetical protein
MTSEFYADRETTANVEACKRDLQDKLADLQNFLMMAPIELPHRNVIRGVLTGVLHLTSELGSEKTRLQEFRMKVSETLNTLSND